MGKESKTEIVKIRMTAKEKAELQKLAGQHHMNMSDYIRRVSARPPNVTKDEFEDSVTRVIYEINNHFIMRGGRADVSDYKDGYH